MGLSLRQIRYFIATAELGQISRAAVELSISQSAITAAIRELEQEVNSKLFERSPTGMELTAAGRQFLFHAYEILQKVNEAVSLKLPSAAISGEIAVTATYTVIGYFLPHHLQRMRRAFPGLKINLVELNREAIEEGLLSNRFDLAVLLTSNLTNPRIASETMVSSSRRLWVPSRHPLLHKDRVGLEDVANEPYIMLTVDEAAHTSMKYWSQTLYQPKVRLRTSSVEAVRSLVAGGHGVTVLSDMVYRPWSLEGQRLETIQLRDAVPPMEIGLAWNATTAFTPEMEAFRSYFRQSYHMPQSRSGNRTGFGPEPVAAET